MFAVVVTMLLVTSVPGEAFAQLKIATWDKDMDKGGNVEDFEAWIAETNRLNLLAVIRGKCWSACALKLGATNVCIYPSATIHFHSVHLEKSTAVLPEDNRHFISTFPPQIQQWVIKNRAMDSVVRHKILTGRTAILLGIPDCTLILK